MTISVLATLARDLRRCAIVFCAAAAGCSYAPGPQRPQYIPTSNAFSPRSVATPSFQTLYNFNFRDGSTPWASLIDVGGTLYGTTSRGGLCGPEFPAGTLFSLTTTGAETVLHNFGCHSDGSVPIANVIDVKGTLYGTTSGGGKYGGGTVFSISRNDTKNYRVLYNFGVTPSDGSNPVASLIDTGGTLYGTTPNGGTYGQGTVFSISTTGTDYRMLHSFGKSTDGSQPDASLIAVRVGTSYLLYGTTYDGGAHKRGAVFSISTTGAEHVLHSFSYGDSDGHYPRASLIDVGGTLYGTTPDGGANGKGTIFSITSGREDVLYSFGEGTNDAVAPFASLIYIGGTLYGTTILGGPNRGGTVFSISPAGTNYLVLYSFGFYAGPSGTNPLSSLFYVNGTLYGTTYVSGAYGNGTVFALTL
ncbi:MAG: hypothetical protein JO302_05475 [Candidatus Eremiobacteraeota bacterium]|nr:hypothetical protein [Candidatus Eremiobacteraeota bacterium]